MRDKVKKKEYDRIRYQNNREANLAHSKAWREANQDRRNLYVRVWTLKKHFGLSLAEYEAILEKQNHRCAICKEPVGVKKRKLSVDHDHKSGKVRGLLCGACNPGLGSFHDKVEYLQAAIDYLRSHA